MAYLCKEIKIKEAIKIVGQNGCQHGLPLV
jgi:hypothetical protein